jgi:hypothetical protein
MSKQYVLKGDARLNPMLKKQVVGLRSRILGKCNKHGLPKRFALQMSKDEPAGAITDCETGRTTSLIGLYALSEVRVVLNELFG